MSKSLAVRIAIGKFVALLLLGIAPAANAHKEVTLGSRAFSLSETGEVAIELEARAPGASWKIARAEAPSLRIEVDGTYNQNLLLWAGDDRFKYRVMLGQLPAGAHRVTVSLDRTYSAPGAQSAIVSAIRTNSLDRASKYSRDDLLALAHSPVLYQRANTIGRFTDVPLLMYYEILRATPDETLIKYTTIFSNEDGGTASAALMARWGRASDIEWTYEVRLRSGHIIEEQYQGVSHETKPFKGRRFNGNHPLLAVASDNNNFSDQIETPVLFALCPIAANLKESSRETVMDENPWSYRIVAEELFREGKLSAGPTDINIIADPRNYVYLDIAAKQSDTSLSVEVRSKEQLNNSFSDLGDPKLRVERSGVFRTAVRLSSPESAAGVSEVSVHCYSTLGNKCRDVELRKVLFFSRDYRPHFKTIQAVPKRDLEPNEKLTVNVR